MILLTLSVTLAAFYLGAIAGVWLTSKGRVSAYLEGAKDGIGFERRRREADDA